ncbi:MAG TPA: hypothetical protein VFW11_19320 [Cyclobacteriaceae bacterium]|nr:hypothetical protein [Cyclobacteriaceae bacterium]
MTKLNEPIRQASLFTMGGLPDPRLMPGYERNESRKADGAEQKGGFIKILFNIYSFLNNPFARKLSNTRRGV